MRKTRNSVILHENEIEIYNDNREQSMEKKLILLLFALVFLTICICTDSLLAGTLSLLTCIYALEEE